MSRTSEITRQSLSRAPLPKPDAGDDKDARGRVLVVGGCTQVPGAMLLAGVAALRAGAGKLQLATVASATSAFGIAAGIARDECRFATSGSGDTLAGIIAGLAARGTPATVAARWGVYLHAAAGRALARRMGTIGFLARERLDEIPTLMQSLG